MKNAANIGENLTIFFEKKFGKAFGDKEKWGQAINMSPPSLNQYLKNKRAPGAKILLRLASIGCNLNWLLTGIGEPIISVEKVDAKEEVNKYSKNSQLFAGGEGASNIGSSSSMLGNFIGEPKEIYNGVGSKTIQSLISTFDKEIEFLRGIIKEQNKKISEQQNKIQVLEKELNENSP